MSMKPGEFSRPNASVVVTEPVDVQRHDVVAEVHDRRVGTWRRPSVGEDLYVDPALCLAISRRNGQIQAVLDGSRYMS